MVLGTRGVDAHDGACRIQRVRDECLASRSLVDARDSILKDDNRSRPAEWMLLLLSSGFWGLDLVECLVCFLLEFGVAAGSDFESA
ncbi:hypothetical protein FB472_1194 [Rhodoglobus vestalii]|uniref:Uncharacterized protein n=1 Tax=Rhodoglobus vestalii TaxID=193384 RepID=A0A8H2PTS3_9MICO|nr:hypothetical protein FB472_1194 [Rhodoglobus vestalii]